MLASNTVSPATRSIRRILVAGGEPSLIQGNLGKRFAQYGIKIDWHVDRVPVLEAVPAGCDAVVIIKDMIRHSLAESAASQAKAAGLPFALIQRKWSQSLKVLRDKGILPATAAIIPAAVSALPPVLVAAALPPVLAPPSVLVAPSASFAALSPPFPQAGQRHVLPQEGQRRSSLAGPHRPMLSSRIKTSSVPSLPCEQESLVSGTSFAPSVFGGVSAPSVSTQPASGTPAPQVPHSGAKPSAVSGFVLPPANSAIGIRHPRAKLLRNADALPAEKFSPKYENWLGVADLQNIFLQTLSTVEGWLTTGKLPFTTVQLGYSASRIRLVSPEDVQAWHSLFFETQDLISSGYFADSPADVWLSPAEACAWAGWTRETFLHHTRAAAVRQTSVTRAAQPSCVQEWVVRKSLQWHGFTTFVSKRSLLGFCRDVLSLTLPDTVPDTTFGWHNAGAYAVHAGTLAGKGWGSPEPVAHGSPLSLWPTASDIAAVTGMHISSVEFCSRSNTAPLRHLYATRADGETFLLLHPIDALNRFAPAGALSARHKSLWLAFLGRAITALPAGWLCKGPQGERDRLVVATAETGLGEGLEDLALWGITDATRQTALPGIIEESAFSPTAAKSGLSPSVPKQAKTETLSPARTEPENPAQTETAKTMPQPPSPPLTESLATGLQLSWYERLADQHTLVRVMKDTFPSVEAAAEALLACADRNPDLHINKTFLLLPEPARTVTLRHKVVLEPAT